MNRTIELTIDETQNGLKVKTVLSASMGLSRREISRLKFTGGLLLNNETCRVTETVRTGDQLTLVFSEHDAAHALILSGEPEILYEDDDLVIVNKPAGMPCHPSHEHLDDDMGTLLQNRYGGSFTIRAVGRLDKDVSGIMVYAKNQPAAARISKQREKGELKKEYLAVTAGIWQEKQGTLTYRLQKKEGRRDRQISASGQLCITDYAVIRETGNRSLLKVSIRTGRTHQIRAGMANAGHPLEGDKLYGGNCAHLHRPALHCARLVLKQPFTEKEIRVEAEMPAEMQELVR